MDTDRLLERLLDQSQQTSEAVSAVHTETCNIVQRLDKVNGSLEKHQVAINAQQAWIAKQEHVNDALQADIKELKSASGVTSAAAIKIAVICSATLLAITKASGPVVTAIAGMLK